MAVNRITSKIVLNSVFRGIYHDKPSLKYRYKIAHVSEQMFSNMELLAKRIGQKISSSDVNDFLFNVKHLQCIEHRYWYSLSLHEIMPGEIHKIGFVFEGRKHTLELMCMKKLEFLLIDSSLPEVMPKSSVIQFFDTAVFANNKELFIGKLGVINVTETSQVVPTEVFYCLNSFFMENLYKYPVSENLWFCYNKISDFLKNSNDREETISLLLDLQEDGLSMFVFSKMLDSFC